MKKCIFFALILVVSGVVFKGCSLARQRTRLEVRVSELENLLDVGRSEFDTTCAFGFSSIHDLIKGCGSPQSIHFVHSNETYEAPFESCSDGVEIKYAKSYRYLFDCSGRKLKAEKWLKNEGWNPLTSSP